MTTRRKTKKPIQRKDVAERIEKEAGEPIETQLEDAKVVGFKNVERIYEPGFFGKIIHDRVELSLIEAMLLLKKERIIILNNGKPMTEQELFEHAGNVDKEFVAKYRVFEDLRGRGLVVRTGYKFGTHFRVYDRGVSLKKGPKSAKEHTKWVVHAVAEDYNCSFQELSRAVRLAHNIRAKMLWAIVDNEGDCTYLQITRHKP